MKKYIRGFFMAWGNFSAVPCPSHKWYEESRKAMLAMFPLVGLMLGVIVSVAWWILDLMGAPAILTGAILTVFYFICNGFIHMDGFMDCSDAILSRRPELEERQRILKASDVGAFAVISVVFMALIFASSMMTLAEEFSIEKASILVTILLISRGMGADYVSRKPAMKTSQYVNLDDVGTENLSPEEKKKRGAREHWALNLALIIPILIIPRAVGDLGDMIYYSAIYGAVAIIVLAAALIAGNQAIKKLGGMNGDIAGYMIVMSETIGVLSTAILTTVLL